MTKFALRLAGLAALAVLWAMVLWFVVRPDFAAWSPIGLLALHGLPPVLIWVAGWAGLRFVSARREARALALAEDARQQQEQAASASLQHQREALARRRMALPVLAAVVAVDGDRDPGEWLASMHDRIVVLPPDDVGWPEATDEAAAADMQPIVERVLHETLASCPAAAAFPVRIFCSAALAGKTLVDCVNTVMSEHWEASASAPSDPVAMTGQSIACVSDGAHLMEYLFSTFDTDAALPGMIVLAVDSSRPSEAGGDDDADITGAAREHRRWHGAPAQAVVAVVVGSPRLGEMLATVGCKQEGDAAPRDDASEPAMRPFWDAGQILPEPIRAMAALDPDVREELSAGIPVGLLHRPEAVQFEVRPGRVGALATAVRRTLERGLVNAGQLPMPGLEENAPESGGDRNADAAPPSPSCDWLVHNAGSIDVAGERLAGISLAMHQLGIDLNPIDEATNFPAALGDLGMGLPLAMLAQAANKVAEKGAPSCWAHFVGNDSLHLGMLTPGLHPLSYGLDRPEGGAAA